MPPDDLIRAFVDAINAHDVPRILSLCTNDHEFVDAYGAITPAENLAATWAGYFGFMPHYGVEVETILCGGELAAVFGHAWGGLNRADPTVRSWRRPCAWRAELRDGRIRRWQVYVDTKAVFDLL